jgi:NAD+ kinase
MNRIRSIKFVVNTSKPGADSAAEELAKIARAAGVDTSVTTEYPLPANSLLDVDLCCAIGGDGTLLSVLDAALASQSAVLGINMGKLGFLATFTKEEAAVELPKLVEGDYEIAERSVIKCTTANGELAYGLNDAVIKESQGRGLIRLYVSANEDPVSEYHCDGLIFSTPTGSTAYNLSAGGPIIGPLVSAIAMTPICPHTLGNRSVIFDNSTTISVTTGKDTTTPRVSIDGRIIFDSEKTFPITISVAEQKLRLMQRRGHSHFSIVRDKLNWGDPAIR